MQAPDPRNAVINLNAGGLSSSLGAGNTLNVTSSAARQGVVGNLAKTFETSAGLLAEQRANVTPGVGALTRSRLAGVQDNRSRTISTLRENLSRRRIGGSSFAADTVSRAEAEFSRQEDLVRAESFLAELDATVNLIGQEFAQRAQVFTTALNELNLQAEVGAALQSSTQQLFAQAQQLEMQAAIANAELEAQSQAGFGSLLGTIAGGAAGFALGGPTGALAGASIGSGGGGNLSFNVG